MALVARRDPGLSMYHRETQSWIPVPPSLPGGFLVNTGELLYRLTNGQWRNTVHRVEPQPLGHARHAVVTFVDLHDGPLSSTLSFSDRARRLGGD
jgi:isopenicillin N synthase-like dioxygenase